MMTQFTIEARFASSDSESFENFLVRVQDAFDEIGVEAIITASLTNLTASFLMEIDAENPLEAYYQALGDVRTALHTAGCGTAGWPTVRDVAFPACELIAK